MLFPYGVSFVPAAFRAVGCTLEFIWVEYKAICAVREGGVSFLHLFSECVARQLTKALRLLLLLLNSVTSVAPAELVVVTNPRSL